ncbi:MAG: response regulator [Planctomycetota bacterium]|jgi:DNA-binding NtrC family response regulator
MHPARVLIVDDEEIVRRSCKRALTEAGYAVRTVGSGGDAINACRAERFDLMLTDLRMPDMDGFEVIRRVTREFPEVRVVIITGYPSRESAERAEELGIFDYLEKPLSPARLSAATSEALSHPPTHSATASEMTAPDSDRAFTAGKEPREPEEAEPEKVAKPKMGTLTTLALLAVAPLFGLAYVALLPLIGLGILFAVLGIGLAEKLGCK